MSTVPTVNPPAGAQPLASAAQSSFALSSSEFMNLLVTQLQNQDPLNPMDDSQFVSQMAQLSTLEATNSVSSGVQGLAGAQQVSEALALVGKTVGYTDATGAAQTGQVSGVSLNGPVPLLTIGKQQIPISSVQTVLE